MITARIVKQGFAEALAALRGAPTKFDELNAKSAFRVGNRAVNAIKRDYRSAVDTTDTATAVRTGRLRSSYTHDVIVSRNGVRLDIGILKARDSRLLQYAAIMENDGPTTITPKKGRYLAVPLPAARTEKGVARGGPRDYANTFIVAGMGGSPIICQRVGDNVVPLFVLKRSVTVHGRPALRPVGERMVIPEMREEVKSNFEALLNPAGAA